MDITATVNAIKKVATAEMLMKMVQDVNSYNGDLEDFDYGEIEEDLDDRMVAMTAIEIIQAVESGDFKLSHTYFQIGVYGGLNSYSQKHVDEHLEEGADEIIEEWVNLAEEGNADEDTIGLSLEDYRVEEE